MEGLNTTVFDDGSTLTWSNDYGFVASTNATDTLVNQPSATWSPQAANPHAQSWGDVLKFGLARIIDAKTRPVAPENTVPVYQHGVPLFQGQDAGLLFWLIVGGIAFFALSD
ncbi:MAG: hypothetical protein ACT4PS_08715 [Betaproteobacteria bacterium]